MDFFCLSLRPLQLQYQSPLDHLFNRVQALYDTEVKYHNKTGQVRSQFDEVNPFQK